MAYFLLSNKLFVHLKIILYFCSPKIKETLQKTINYVFNTRSKKEFIH